MTRRPPLDLGAIRDLVAATTDGVHSPEARAEAVADLHDAAPWVILALCDEVERLLVLGRRAYSQGQ